MGSAELSSEHPVGQSILRYVRQIKKIPDLVQPVDAKIHVGEGISCFFNSGLWVHVGNQKMIARVCPSSIAKMAGTSYLLLQGKTVIHVAIGNEFFGSLAVSDIVKPEAAALVRSLHHDGKEVWMLTGDHVTTANIIASSIGIEHVEAGVSPVEKAKKIKELQATGRRVIMVGDGINDAIALAQADVSGIRFLIFSQVFPF